jgi:hypothetical protein
MKACSATAFLLLSLVLVSCAKWTILYVDHGPPRNATGSAENREQRGPPCVRVPGDVPTIREAVDLVADGGTVRIASGTYSESIDIYGKRINLIGSALGTVIMGPTPTESVPLSHARGLVNYGAGGGGHLRNLTLVGGDVGVMGIASGDEPPSGVRIGNVSMVQNGRGVAGGFTRLSLNNVSIVSSLVHGISLVCPEAVELRNAFVADAGQLGMLVISCNETESISVDHVSMVSNSGGGAAFFGNMNIGITESTFLANRIFGILLAGVSNTTLVINTVASATTKGDTPKFNEIGDGLTAVGTGTVILLDCEFVGNERAGVLLADSPTEGRFVETLATANRFGVVLAPGQTGGCGTLVEFGAENIFTGNTERDILQGCGDLPIPDQPPSLPDP